MKNVLATTATLVLIGAFIASAAASDSVMAPASRPPVGRVDPVTDDYSGIKVIDNYRWMEAKPEPQFRDYLDQQNDYTHATLSRIPGRDKIQQDLAALDDLQSLVFTVVPTAGKRFYLKRAPGAQGAKLFMSDAASGKETLLVDPDALKSGDHHATINEYAPSRDGKLIAYTVALGGSEQSVLHVMDTTTGKDLSEAIDRAIAANVSWLPDNASFFYTRMTPLAPGASPNTQFDHQHVYLHRVGTDPDKDRLVLDADHLPFAFKAAQIWPNLATTAGSDHVIAWLADGTGIDKALFTASLADVASGKQTEWKVIAQQSDGASQAIVHGDRIFVLTHKDAPRYRIVEENLGAPDFASARTVVAEQRGVLTGMAGSSEALYFAARNGAGMTLSRLPYGATTVAQIALPFTGTIYPPLEDAGSLAADPQAPGAIFGIESWNRPALWLQYDPPKNAIADTGIVPKLVRDFSAYETIETSVRAPDGAMVPLSIIVKHGARLDHSHPTILEGYGSFGISMDPGFRPSFIPWLDRGGVYAIAHVRGGGELGEPWHAAGMLANKQNTITDFISCAQALIDMGYTSPRHLAAQGASAGGITVGDAIIQRPDLFAAAIIEAGGVNPIRFDQTPVGPNLIPEFGSVANPTQFPSILKMDPFQQMHDGTHYPAVLLTGGFNDPRVPIWMPAKMTARLQAATSSGKPILLRVDFDDGHGMGATSSQRDSKRADELAFVLWQTGAADFQPSPQR